ncbi:cold regulated protein [Quillaja saponaria]|uniref:Cold regulated protein n=1 Tax=Quillaja saponaria TaxID=32244 RepID=A0AAD7M081_QUISA|nr:cold regulated protein [Quillaja saponaria]
MRLRGWCLQDNVKEANASRALLVNPCNLSEKFLVQQDGCSQEINFEKNEPMLESTADSHVIAGSLLRHHSTNEERSYTVRVSELRDNTSLFNEGYHSRGNSTFSCETPRSSEQGRSCHLHHLDLAGSNAEVIDQNFEDENRGTKSSCVPEAKKLRTAADDASSNDQVVPLGKFNKADVSTGPLSLENEQHELLSENPESFFFSKSDLHHFLRGS